MRIKLFALFLLIFGFTNTGFSQDLLINQEKASLLSIMKQANVTFDHNSALNFSLDIPQNFRIVPKDRLRALDMGERFFGEVFEAYGPAIELGLRPYIKVISVGVLRIVSPEKWFQIEVLNKGNALRDLNVISNNEIRVSYVRLGTAGYEEIVSARIFHHQNRLVIVEYSVPAKMFDTQEAIQKFSVDSFRFQNDYQIMAKEEVRSFVVEGLNIEYPQSWRFKLNKTDAINRQEFEIEAIDRDQFIFANVNGVLIANRSLRDRLDRTFYLVNLKEELITERQRIKGLGFIIEDPMEAHRYDNKFETNFSVVEVYPMRRALNSAFVVEQQNEISHELWLVAIRTPKDIGKNYIFTMVTPSREQNYTQWAYAVDGLKYIVESLR